jgi:YtcA family
MNFRTGHEEHEWTGKLTANLPSPHNRILNRMAAAGASLALPLLAAGCSRAPSFNILGSFFPSWILCGVLGIVLASLVRVFFVRIKLEEHLWWPLVLIYPSLTLFFTFTIWLLFFS